MEKFLVILVTICLCIDNSIAIEKCNTLGKSDIYVSSGKYQNPFPYNIELKCNNIKYSWNGSSIIANLTKTNKLINYEKFIDNIQNVIYDFKKKFHENSEMYFKYLLSKSYDNIENNIVQIDHNGILETYNNPFDKNPFIFRIDNEIFQWNDSKIIMNRYCNKYKNRLNNILIDFNDSFEYFIYLLKNVVKVQSYKIDIKYDKNIYNNYNNLTLKTTINNPLNNMVIIKDCLRTYRWYNNIIEILFPDWLNDNLYKNNYSVFLQLLERATTNFNNTNKNNKKLDDFEYFINQEFGNNIIVYALNIENLGWESITNTKVSYISTVTNHNTGFVEVEKMTLSNYDWDNDKDDF